MREPFGTSETASFESMYISEPNSGCWLWTGSIDAYGYGKFSGTAPTYYAHRWSYQKHIGPIPDGLVIDHLCRVPSCVNPDHMEPVTQKTNILRGNSPFAMKARQTHCKNGHEFTLENIYRQPGRSSRQCWTCMRQKAAVRNAARKLRRDGGK